MLQVVHLQQRALSGASQRLARALECFDQGVALVEVPAQPCGAWAMVYCNEAWTHETGARAG
jgi:hypothetical protein